MVRCLWPGFNSRTGRHMWAEFVFLYSAPSGVCFSPGTPFFSSPQKLT